MVVLHSQSSSPQQQQQLPQQLAQQSSYGDQQIYRGDRQTLQFLPNRNDQQVDPSLMMANYNNHPKQNMFNTDRAPMPFMRTDGLSAWGFIALIMFVITLGMIIYYCVMCYPLLWGKHSSNRHSELLSTSSGTPMQNASDFDEFEAKRNYSSRSTTPSKSHDDPHGIHNEAATLKYLEVQQPHKEV